MSKLPEHLFVSSADGALYDTRVANWSHLPPLRANYDRTARRIESVADLKATLRAGGFAWPGGYPLYFFMADGDAISFKTARAEFRSLIDGIKSPYRHDSWKPVAVAINYEDSGLTDAHTGEKIECAYDALDAEDAA